MSAQKNRLVENSIMRLALEATEEMIGRTGLNAVLRLAALNRYIDNPPPDNSKVATPGADLAALLAAIIDMYGEQVARGIFRRWGHAFGRIGAERRPVASLIKPMLNLLPLHRRMRVVLETLVREADAARGEHLHTLREFSHIFTITFEDCLYCHGMRVDSQICLTVVGTIESVLKWGTGHEYDVIETACIGHGDPACVFQIAKKPLDV